MEMTIHDDDVLRKINERIIKLKGHDFQIGHSYFMDNHIDLKAAYEPQSDSFAAGVLHE
ncbi:MAG: hypothetical protein U5K71_14805 [Gracilimonas sp.]|nr:hypothetical protein [Gracilimonas sp.]